LADISIYTSAKTVSRTVCDHSKCFEVKTGVHQVSALSPLLFVIVMETILKNSELPYHIC